MKLALFEAPPPTKSYLVWQEGKVMVFRKPPSLRRPLLVIAGIMTVVEIVNLVMSRHNSLVFSFNLVTGFCLLAFLVYLSGPSDIRLDGDQRTYERITGWPWKPATQFGSFDDIKGVCVSLNGQAMLLMNKRIFPYKGVVLSSSGTKGTADALAEDLSREFGFPIVAYPK